MCTQRHTLKAFSIGEVILAAFVLTVGIIAMLRLITSSYSNSSASQDMIIAAELAQEGVELVRNIRDNNLARRVDNWTTGDNCQASYTGGCDTFRFFPINTNGNSKRCSIDYTYVYNNGPYVAGDPTGRIHCNTSDNALTLDGNGFYVHSGAASGRFYRIIKIDVDNRPGPNATALVQSIVTWRDPGSSYDGANSIGNCTLANKCVYAELLLESWK